MMKIYNTLNKKIEELKPLKNREVNLYTCGPTVYDFTHIGNLRNFVFYDTLRRTLVAEGYKVNHVMNITDVGHLTSDADEGADKLEKGAQREGKSVWEVANYYTDIFKKDSAAMRILKPNAYKNDNDQYARATDFIKEQIEIVKILMDKGIAYQTEQAIYFDVSQLPDYGKLTGQKLEDKEVASREEVIKDSSKRNPHDFALWFFTVGHFKGHTMHWSSPWGDGFPGWHLECSAIIHSTLRDPIDIHGGGVDLIGTHHTNEMAQTEAAFGNGLANYWVHSEHLQIDNKKISKSLRNYLTLDNIIERGFDPLALRLLFLQAHYKSQLNFTWQSLEDMQNVLDHFNQWADLRFQKFESEKLAKEYENDKKSIIQNLSDDLNTPQALAIFNKMLDKVDDLGPDTEAIKSAINFIDEVFALTPKNKVDLNLLQKELLAKRQSARNSKNWSEADQIRQKLNKDNIGIRDSSFGQIWYRQK